MNHFWQKFLASEILWGVTAIILYLIGYFSVWSPIFFIATMACVALFVLALVKQKLRLAIVIFACVILLQNIAYALLSSVLARFVGEAALVKIITTKIGKIASLLFLETKLVLLASAFAYIAFQDVLVVIRTRKLSVLRTFGYALMLWLIIAAGVQIASKYPVMAVLGSFRNYFALVTVPVVGVWFAKRDPSLLLDLLTRKFMIPVALALITIQAATMVIFSNSLYVWQEIVGVRYLYFAKQFFVSLPLATVTDGRFYTDLLGMNFVRTGGIYLEPVNYGYVAAFLLIWLMLSWLNSRKTTDFLLLFATVFLFIFNMGKGALLFAVVVLGTYAFLKIIPARAKLFYGIWIAGVIALAVGIFALAPSLSIATLGHTEPVEQLSSVISWDNDIPLLGSGLGTNGNFTTSGVIRESAVAVTFVELGGIWLLLYVVFFSLIGWNIFTQDRHKLLVAFGMCGSFAFILSGLFQENIFSLQVSFFTLFLGCLLFASREIQVSGNPLPRE